MRAVAALLTGNGLVVIVASALFPLHLGEDAGSPANRSNTMVMALGVFLLLLAMGLSAASRRSWFRLISAGILAAFAVLTVAGLVVSRVVPESERVSTVGVQERTMVAGFLAWEALLALDLLRAREGDLG